MPAATSALAFVNRIHQGDCIAGMNSLPAECVDLAFADPPFNIGYKYDVYDDHREHEHYIEWSKEWIAAVHRVLKPNGTFWLAIGDDYAAELKLASEAIGFHSRSWVIWYYTFGVNCTNKFTRSHTHLFYFVKNPESFTFQADDPANRIPSARQLVYNDARANPKGRLPDDTWILRPQDLADCFTTEEDTWYFPRVAGTFKERAGFHGCQMPEQLLGRIIRSCSNESDIVLDPFSGSATTLVTAKKLARRYVGFELSEQYAARGAERLEQAQVGATLVGAADPTRSAPSTANGKPLAGRARKGSSTEQETGQAPQASDSSALRAPSSALLIEAFRRACGGFSLDRVAADPKLQDELVRQCRALKIPGDAKAWNAALFRLRKAGKLTGVPTTERTELAWADCESHLAPAEIALALLLGRDADESLDDLLSDPKRAAAFDRLALRYGGRKKTFEYRWAALKLRKEAKVIRERAQAFRRRELQWSVPIALARGGRLDRLAPEPGLYAIFDGEGERLYVGAATDLRSALVRQLPKARRKLYVPSGDVRVSVVPLAASFTDLLALRQAVLAKSPSTLNWRLPVGEEPHRVATAKNGRAATVKPARHRRRAVAETAHG